MTSSRATWMGSSFVLLASFAALWTSYIKHTPPFLAAGLVLTVGFICFMARWGITGAPWRDYFRQPPKVWVLGLYGIPTYFALYTTSFQMAPVVEANLLNYVWPLTLVLMTVVMDKKPLRWFQTSGLILCCAGLLFLTAARSANGLNFHWGMGHTLALLGGLVWGSYSALARRFPMIDSNVTGVFFGLAALVNLSLSAVMETWPALNQVDWIPIVTGGVIVQFNFFAWDIGMKKGNARLLGVMAYMTPILSLSWLVLCGRGQMTNALYVAAALVIGGAVLAGLDRFQALVGRK